MNDKSQIKSCYVLYSHWNRFRSHAASVIGYCMMSCCLGEEEIREKILELLTLAKKKRLDGNLQV